VPIMTIDQAMARHSESVRELLPIKSQDICKSSECPHPYFLLTAVSDREQHERSSPSTHVHREYTCQDADW
jgi:hypothetical protein